MEETKVTTETLEVECDDLLSKIKDVIHEGDVRRIAITSDEGKRLIEIPVTVGAVGTVLLPVWAEIGAIAAIVTKATIEIERVGGVGRVEWRRSRR